jgi:hypothetical protein
VTDDDAVAAALALGGAGLKVDQTFGTPEGVRAWLARAAAVAEKEDRWPAW